jgi:hypothetical protein
MGLSMAYPARIPAVEHPNQHQTSLLQPQWRNVMTPLLDNATPPYKSVFIHGHHSLFKVHHSVFLTCYDSNMLLRCPHGSQLLFTQIFQGASRLSCSCCVC